MSQFVIRKLREERGKVGLETNFNKSKYRTTTKGRKNLEIDEGLGNKRTAILSIWAHNTAAPQLEKKLIIGWNRQEQKLTYYRRADILQATYNKKCIVIYNISKNIE